MIRSVFAGLALAFCLPTVAAAQNALPVATRAKTPAGIEVLYATIPSAERTVIQFLWRDNAAVADTAASWIQVLAPPLFADGPVGETRGAFSEKLKDIDAGYSWSVGLQGLTLSVNAKAGGLMPGAEAIAAMIATPRFSEQRFEELRSRTVQTWRQNLTTTETQANVIATRLQASNAPVSRIRTFDEAALQEAKLDDLLKWRKQVMGRANLVVAAAGPSSFNDVARAVDVLLASVPTGRAAPERPKVPPSVPMQRSVHIDRAAAQTIVVLTGPVGVEPGLEASQITMALRILSRGFDSRLYRAVREGLGAAYGIFADQVFLGRGERLLLLRAPVDHQRAKAAHDAMVAEYERFWREGATEAELTAAKEAARLFVSELSRNPGQVASQMVQLEAEGLGLDAMQRVPAAVQAMTLQEFNAFIRQKLPPPPLGLVVVGPADTAPKADCVISGLAAFQGCKK